MSTTPFIPTPAGLCCDDVPLAAIAAEIGTPVYVYDARSIREAWRALDDAFAGHPHHLHYALKANSTLAIARLLRAIGSHADANSGGEIEVALRAGFTPDQIVFTGVGKTTDELARAIALGIGTINVESAGELDRVDALARQQGRAARVAVRVNPNIDARTHAHISTGLRTDKFGVPLADVRAIYHSMASRPAVRAVGVHVHIGSQILTLDPIRDAARTLVELATALRAEGHPIEHVDLGGGLGIAYDGGTAPSAAEYAAAVLPIVRESGFTLVLEPGRVVVGPSGALVARVVDTKRSAGGPSFVVLDAGMTELMRPALYGAFHRIVAVGPPRGADAPVDVVGPICESSDIFGRDRLLPPLEVGDLVAILDAGAYGSAMGSTYNRRRLPAEALVDEGRWQVIRRRQTIDDLLALEP